MRSVFKKINLLFILGIFATPSFADVAIYTGGTSWITPEAANAQAQICQARLEALGIVVTIFSDPADEALLADWVDVETDDGDLDVLILFGRFPNSIYPGGNAEPDGSLAELFIESVDGDAIINHADWMFYVSDPLNTHLGLENMTDTPGLSMGGNNNPMTVTDLGREIAPSLNDFLSDRPLHVDGLGGDWIVEASLAQSADGLLADPVVIRDGDRGRLIPIFQANAQPDPMGAVAAEIIAWLLEETIVPTKLTISGAATNVSGNPIELTISTSDDADIPTAGVEVTIDLATDSASGAFDLSPFGDFDGSVTSVTIPESGSLTVFYQDSTAGLKELTASTSGDPALTEANHTINLFEDLSGDPGEVAIYTGNVGWINKGAADVEAQICSDKLALAGVTTTLFPEATDTLELADWVIESTDNGVVDVLILFGFLPGELYGAGNTEIDGSLIELFIESTDGDVVINHADYMFYVSDPINNIQGLQNIMDSPAVTMWGDNNPMMVTELGRRVAPSLGDFLSDRPLHLDQMEGDWFPEVILAKGSNGILADPVIVRDGNRGRLAPIFQTNVQNDPKGAVAAETILFLYGVQLGEPNNIAILGDRTAAFTGEAIPFTVAIQDDIGSPSIATNDVTVSIQTNSATGAFDLAADGAFDGSITELTIPAGSSSVSAFYSNTAPGQSQVTATLAGFDPVSQDYTFFEKSFAPQGEVAIWTGTVNWIDKGPADEQAQICQSRLESAGISSIWYQEPTDGIGLSEWISDSTDNGSLDVLVLYGHLPSEIYPAGNTMPEGSILELFLESPDGDTVINHADWMFYVSDPINGPQGLGNLMDLPSINMAGFNDLPMVVTEKGMEISSNLTNFNTDRPLHLNTLGGNWIVEEVLAQNADGTLAEPVIVRDGDRGRLIPVYQTQFQNDPKGAVASDIIAYLFGGASFGPSQVNLNGSGTTVTDTAIRLTVSLQDGGGVPVSPVEDTVINLATDSASGRFDTNWLGTYDGTVTSVTIPAGEPNVKVYYKTTQEGLDQLTATIEGNPELQAGELSVNVLTDSSGEGGSVAIYTGQVNWVEKVPADAQAQICVDLLNDAGIANQWFSEPGDDFEILNWVIGATDNGEVDVLVLYGYLPDTIYGAANSEPDNSLLELYLESTDGDVVINHADYMFYVSSQVNNVNGLQNIMDLPNITMWGNDDAMTVTDQGAAISSSLVDFLSDRPFHVNELSGDWFVEAALAESADGTLADPVIVRDGNRGRLIPVHQANVQDDPKGAVAAEIITYLFSGPTDTGSFFRRGDADGNGALEITDPINNLSFQFLGTFTPPCMDAADFDDNGKVEITDPIANLSHQFLGTAPPAPPGKDTCGPDPTADDDSVGGDLGCLNPPTNC